MIKELPSLQTNWKRKREYCKKLHKITLSIFTTEVLTFVGGTPCSFSATKAMRQSEVAICLGPITPYSVFVQTSVNSEEASTTYQQPAYNVTRV